MNSSKFGPIAWSVYFTLASDTCIYKDWDELTIEQFLLVIASNAMILPCSFCRESFRIFIRILDLRKWFQGPKCLQPVNRTVATEYLFILHNLVNQKLDKPWHFDRQSAVATNLLVDERKLMQTVFEWLYILFLNYPEHLGPIDSEDTAECCNEMCQKAHQQLSNEFTKKTNRCTRKIIQKCVGEPLSDALEHLKRQISTLSFIQQANAQGVTIGSLINQKVVVPAYETLDVDIRDAIDLYTFTKISWYMIFLQNITNLILNSERIKLSVEAIRSLRQIQTKFLSPSASASASAKNKVSGRCACFLQTEQSIQTCLKNHLGPWSSSAEAIRNLNVAQQWWDVNAPSLSETKERIENFRAKK